MTWGLNMTDSVDPRELADQTELFVALVAAVGTDVGMISDEVGVELAEYGYTVHPLRLSEYLAEEAEEDFRKKKNFDEQLWDAMTAGNELRASWNRSDALALHAISDIVATREELSLPVEDEGQPGYLDRHAFVLRSLKTPDELETLRAIYGPRLVVIAAYSPKDQRLEHLATQITGSRGMKDRSTWVYQPEQLIDRDEKEGRARGQNVSGTFHRADFFIRGWSRGVAREDIQRTMEILFGSPFRTPTRDEHGQFLAAGAALRSAEFGRQVGAAIATHEGSIVAVGANEVPKALGGAHWEEDGMGNRDFEIGDIDTNRKHFDELAQQLTERIDTGVEELVEALSTEDPDTHHALEALRVQVRDALPGNLWVGGLKDLTEFGRAVHAEMNALLDAGLRGVPVAGATLYSTTFPCHNCARHIIGAGITRVVFIEPYTKSRAEQLHADSAAIAHSERDPNKVAFEPFVGVAPRRYLEMFDAAGRERLGHLGRKDESGHRREFVKKQAFPVFVDAGLSQFRPEPREYRIKELLALDHLDEHTQKRETIMSEGAAKLPPIARWQD
jgi:deoxycytidylate deaminase